MQDAFSHWFRNFRKWIFFSQDYTVSCCDICMYCVIFLTCICCSIREWSVFPRWRKKWKWRWIQIRKQTSIRELPASSWSKNSLKRCFKIYRKRTRYLHIKIFSDCQYFSIHIHECIHIWFWGEVITPYSFKPDYSCEKYFYVLMNLLKGLINLQKSSLMILLTCLGPCENETIQRRPFGCMPDLHLDPS